MPLAGALLELPLGILRKVITNECVNERFRVGNVALPPKRKATCYAR